MANMNEIKNHPAFLAFSKSNVKMDNKETQAKKEKERDNKEKDKEGGE